MPTTKNSSQEKGFSLIELLCAMFISASLLVVVDKVYVKILTFYRTQADRLEVEHHLMRATTMLRDEIQKAGSIGCAKLNKRVVIINKQTFFSHPLTGTTSEFTVYYADMLSENLLEAHTNEIKVTASRVFKKNDYLLISDCLHAEIAQLKASRKHLGTHMILHKPLQTTFQFPASVSRLIKRHFYIEEFDREQHHFALYMNYQQKRRLLVPYIKSIKIQYYLLNAGQITIYSSVSPTDWAKLVAVKLEISMIKNSIMAHQILFVTLENA